MMDLVMDHLERLLEGVDDINLHEIASHIEDESLRRWLKSWRDYMYTHVGAIEEWWDEIGSKKVVE